MEKRKDPPSNHTERGVIDFLREFGYIETTPENGTWFTKGWTENLSNQVDLRFIEQKCDKVYDYLRFMGNEVYRVCRKTEEDAPHEIFKAFTEALSKKWRYRRGLFLGFVAGFLTAILIWLIVQQLV